MTEQDKASGPVVKTRKAFSGRFGWGGSLGLLKVPILNINTRFLNQNYKICEINKHQCLFKRNMKFYHKVPISLEQLTLPDKKQQPTTETPQAGQTAGLRKAGWLTASEVEARADGPSEGNRSMGSHP